MWKNLQDKQPSHSNQYTARILKTEKKKWGQEKKTRVGEKEKIIKRWREGAKGKKKTLKETLTKIITYQLIIVILIRILIQTGKTIKIQNKMLLTLRHLKNEH